MITRPLAITAWLAVGHALVLALLWALVQVPESNAWMLAASALIAVAAIALTGWVEGVGMAAWTPGTSWRQAFVLTVRALPGAILGVALFGLVWLLTGHLSLAWTSHRGEVDAWVMLHAGWARTAALHATVEWLLLFIRYVVGLSLALTLIGWAVLRGVTRLSRPRWLLAAASPVRLLIITALLAGTMWLPWKAVYWRPRWIEPTWHEPVFVSVKLLALYLVGTIGWAGVLGVVERGCRPRA